MNINEILVRSPINSMAGRVTSQKRVALTESDLSAKEIIAITERLVRKMRLLKLVLQIKTKSQHKNAVYRVNARIPNFRAAKEPRALTEYVICGREIQRLNLQLCEIKKARKAAHRPT